MRYISFVILLIFFTTTIEASYLRSIRLKSFKTDNEAQKSLIELERFIQTHDNILDLQVELDFEFKVIKLGKFYMLCVEPLTQKDVVQELLDTLRTKYADAYPKKIKSISIVKKSKKVIPDAIVIEEAKKIENEEFNKKYLKNQVITKGQISSSNDYIWVILFIITIFVLLIAIIQLYRYRKEDKLYPKDIIYEMSKSKTIQSCTDLTDY